jgi:hypothetical protein
MWIATREMIRLTTRGVSLIRARMTTSVERRCRTRESFAGYPNGRRLEDDVIDTSFLVLSNAGVLPATLTSDCVANDSNFSATFPYLAPAN